MAPSPSSPASAACRAATRRRGLVGGCLGHEAEPEALHLEGVVALGHLLAGERGAEEAQHVARAPERVARTGCRSSARRSPATTRRCRARSARARRRPSTPPSARAAPGPRVNTGAIATPLRSVGAHAAASASGVKPSWTVGLARPHVGEARARRSPRTTRGARGARTPGMGTVTPKRRGTAAIGRIYAAHPPDAPIGRGVPCRLRPSCVALPGSGARPTPPSWPP